MEDSPLDYAFHTKQCVSEETLSSFQVLLLLKLVYHLPSLDSCSYRHPVYPESAIIYMRFEGGIGRGNKELLE